MNQEECKEIKQALELFLNESLERVLMSNPADSGKISRSRIRPLLMKGRLVFQAEEQAGKQAFHRNLDNMRRQTMSQGCWRVPSARRRLHPDLERPLYW